jgi:hypothetical protein
VADLDLVLALSPAARQEDAPASHQTLKRALQCAGSDFRALKVAEKGDWTIGVIGGGTHVDGRLAVGRLVAMREVEASDIHAGFQELAQDGLRSARRPDRADDPRPSDHR